MSAILAVDHPTTWADVAYIAVIMLGIPFCAWVGYKVGSGD